MTNLQEFIKARKEPVPDLPFYKHPDYSEIYLTKAGHVAYQVIRNQVKVYFLYPTRKTTKGYLFVEVYEGSKIVRPTIHRLVASLFIPNPEGLPYINHKNGIKEDNSIENLEWCTAKHNNIHARYILNHDSQLLKREVDVYKNGVIVGTFPSVTLAANYVGGLHSNVSKCCQGKRLSHKGHTFKYRTTNRT